MIEIAIKSLITADTGDAPDKVICVKFEYSYTEDDVTVVSNSCVSFPNDAEYTTPYVDLTEEQVRQWIVAETELMEALQSSIKLEWNAKSRSANETVHDTVLPWQDS